MVDGSSRIFIILAVIFKAKYSSNHWTIYNNFGSVKIALQSFRIQRWLIIYKDVGLLLIGS